AGGDGEADGGKGGVPVFDAGAALAAGVAARLLDLVEELRVRVVGEERRAFHEGAVAHPAMDAQRRFENSPTPCRANGYLFRGSSRTRRGRAVLCGGSGPASIN